MACSFFPVCALSLKGCWPFFGESDNRLYFPVLWLRKLLHSLLSSSLLSNYFTTHVPGKLLPSSTSTSLVLMYISLLLQFYYCVKHFHIPWLESLWYWNLNNGVFILIKAWSAVAGGCYPARLQECYAIFGNKLQAVKEGCPIKTCWGVEQDYLKLAIYLGFGRRWLTHFSQELTYFSFIYLYIIISLIK